MTVGRVLALDLGEKRIGVALSDPMRMIARPLSVILRTSRAADHRAISRIVKENQVSLVICGHPLSLDGSEGPQGHRLRRYAERLAQALSVPVELWDETYSTVEAESVMQVSRKRMSPQERKEWVDAVAAAVILQGYLDSLSPARESYAERNGQDS